jgi:SP family general alpha glucoside:H+ symporter-like MFS transporter
MSVRQSLRFWWKAIVFSFVISLCVVMEGYDTSLMNKFFAFQPFRNRFGDEVDADGNKLVSARWQTIILNGTQVRRFPLRFLTEGTLLTQKGRMHSRSHHQRLHH